ncbi:hypothetical protein [Streptomyces sp. NPDC048442]|uniref:hypothetical protein n=1 Tax=Streptomyces sp. NPDC048442 TaxID=3154823 RepID=UPI003441A1AD
MAVEQLSPALHAPAHPMAKPGFGKQSVPDQQPRGKADFGHLPAREASIAWYIDRLPDGADISIKTLSRELPAYGQQAVATALRSLADAGHLRRFRELLCGADDTVRWVQRTYFSRTQRPDAWWQSMVRGESTEEETDAPRGEDVEERAYAAMVQLAYQVPQLTLSENACRELAPYAAEWLRRGASEDRLLRGIGQIVPKVVHSPFAFVQAKLIRELPPELPAPRQGVRIMECGECGVPGEPAALPGGLCRPCRSQPYAYEERGLAADVVRGKAERIRYELRDRDRGRGRERARERERGILM